MFLKECRLVAFISLSMNLCFIACGGDDDEQNAEQVEVNLNLGVWKCVSAKVVEDGEQYFGNIGDGEIIRLTINQNNTYEYYVNVGEDEYTEFGTWEWDLINKKLTLIEDNGSVAVIEVLSWTNNKLVTYQKDPEDGGYSEERTFIRE